MNRGSQREGGEKPRIFIHQPWPSDAPLTDTRLPAGKSLVLVLQERPKPTPGPLDRPLSLHHTFPARAIDHGPQPSGQPPTSSFTPPNIAHSVPSFKSSIPTTKSSELCIMPSDMRLEHAFAADRFVPSTTTPNRIVVLPQLPSPDYVHRPELENWIRSRYFDPQIRQIYLSGMTGVGYVSPLSLALTRSNRTPEKHSWLSILPPGS